MRVAKSRVMRPNPLLQDGASLISKSGTGVSFFCFIDIPSRDLKSAAIALQAHYELRQKKVRERSKKVENIAI